MDKHTLRILGLAACASTFTAHAKSPEAAPLIAVESHAGDTASWFSLPASSGANRPAATARQWDMRPDDTPSTSAIMPPGSGLAPGARQYTHSPVARSPMLRTAEASKPVSRPSDPPKLVLPLDALGIPGDLIWEGEITHRSTGAPSRHLAPGLYRTRGGGM